MSMLSSLAKELRMLASELGQMARAYENCGDCGETSNLLNSSADIMREAADTIESLRGRLQELQGVTGESRYSELFGTPERAARTIIDTLAACEGPKCTSGRCPFRQLQHCPDYDDYDALLEWLRGDA